MKKYIFLILLPLFLVVLPSCKSGRNAVSEASLVQEEARWKNVTLPVRVELLEPASFSLNGRATMVRGEYLLISVRMLGFEVGQLYATPEEVDLVVKQLEKIWIQQPIGPQFARLHVPFATFQEALLGEPAAIAALPKRLEVATGGTERRPQLTVVATVNGKKILARLTLSLDEATWDVKAPQTFTTPGSSYRKTDLGSALKRIVL